MAPCSVMSILNGLNSQNSPSGVGPHFNRTHPDAPPPHSNVSSLEIHGNARRIPFFRWLRWAVKSNDLLAMRPHVFGGFSQKQHLLGYLGRDYCGWIDYRHGDILADPIKTFALAAGLPGRRAHITRKRRIIRFWCNLCVHVDRTSYYGTWLQDAFINISLHELAGFRPNINESSTNCERISPAMSDVIY